MSSPFESKQHARAELPAGLTTKPGTWTPATIDGKRSAVACCPSCGQRGTLDAHAIAADGTVTPLLVCPAESCSYHEFVRLVGWRPEGAP